MLSDNVICAIRIMNALSEQAADLEDYEGVEFGRLKELLQIDHPVYRTALFGLRKQNIVQRVSGKYKLCADAGEITLYDLFSCFHRGLPLGNTVVSNYNKGDFRMNRRYRQLRELEIQTEGELSARFQQINILGSLYPDRGPGEQI